MEFSIITISFNSASTIKDTLLSVHQQSYRSFEHIIVDGASSDGTLDIIQNSPGEEKRKVISGPDAGIYNAMNKGLKIAQNSIIGFLNADDVFWDEHVLEKINNYFSNNDVEALYGNLVYIENVKNQNVVRVWKAGDYTYKSFRNGWMPPHPTFFVKKSVYDRLGGFNESFKISGDYELMLRFLHKEKIKVGYFNEFLVKMTIGGVSNYSFKNRLLANKEDRLAWEINRLSPSPITSFLKPIRKVFQYFKK